MLGTVIDSSLNTYSYADSRTSSQVVNELNSTYPLTSPRITQILRKPELEAAMIGIKVTSLNSGKVLFEENANKLLRPASNMKLYTTSAALDAFGPDFKVKTSVYATKPVRKAATNIAAIKFLLMFSLENRFRRPANCASLQSPACRNRPAPRVPA